MTPFEIVLATLGAVTAIAVPIIGWIRSRFAEKDRKIELLTVAKEALEKANNRLELQNLEQRIIGRTVNEFLTQLPKASEPSNKELP